MRAEGGQVFDRQRAAARRHVGGDALRQIALIEIARARCSEMRQRRLELVLRQAHDGADAPLRAGRQAVLEIGGRACRIAPQVRGCTGDHMLRPPVDQQTFAGEGDAGGEQFAPRQFGMAAMRLLHAGDHAGHRDRAGAMQVAVVLHPRPGEDVGGSTSRQRIVFDAQAQGRACAEVDHLAAIFLGAVEHHRPAAANPAHPRLEHAECKAGRDDSIDAIPASGKHRRADLGRFARLRRDNAAFGDNGGLSDLLEVGELVGHVG